MTIYIYFVVVVCILLIVAFAAYRKGLFWNRRGTQTDRKAGRQTHAPTHARTHLSTHTHTHTHTHEQIHIHEQIHTHTRTHTGGGGGGGGQEVERGDLIRSENSPQLMGLANCQPPAFATGSLEQVSKLVFYAHPTSAVISGLLLEQYELANCERKT